jgi:hypothetical protein
MTRTATYYHCSLKPMSRSAGRSAVACAAYRTGASLDDVRYGVVRDFSRKTDVVTSFTLAPDDAPAWAQETAELWNAVEAKENRKNSQLAFEWEVALPNELDHSDREAIARGFAQWLTDEYGVAVTVGIHGGGSRGNGLNDHMHVMMTTREIGPGGWGAKLRDFNTRPGTKNPEVERVREHVADLINDALEESGSAERVSHKSYKARGIEHEPTTHLGPNATAYERQGIPTERGDINREIIEARLVWQHEQAQPEVTAGLEREFAARFGDPLPRIAEPDEARQLPPPQKLEELTPLDARPGEAVRMSPWGGAWRGFADRARRFGELLRDVWDDETSGAPEAERGVAARLLDAGKAIVGGLRGRNAAKFTEGLSEAAELAGELTAKTAEPDGEPPKSWTERLREAAADILRNQRGSVPGWGREEAQGEPEPVVWSSAFPDPADWTPQPPGADDGPPQGDAPEAPDTAPELTPDDSPDIGP